MFEFGFDRKTLRALLAGATLLAMLVFAAGTVTGMLWVDGLTPVERFAARSFAFGTPAPEAILLASRGARFSPDADPAIDSDVVTAVPAASIPSPPIVRRPGPVLGRRSHLTSAARLASNEADSRPEARVRSRREPAARQTRRASVVAASGAAERGSIELTFDEAHPVPATPFGFTIYEAARRHALNPALVAALVRVESSFDPLALSASGARGLMQVLPATASRFGIDEAALYLPESNLEAGLRYLRWLSDRFAGDAELVLAAYNAGEGAVERYGGLPPFGETRRFIERVHSALRLAPPGAD